MTVVLYVYVLIYLAPNAIVDIKTHQIDLKWLLIYLSPLIPIFWVGKLSFIDSGRIYGVAVGLLFIILSIISSGALGMGDSAVITWLGYVLGAIKLVEILGVAWFLCFLTGVVRIIRKNKKEIPLLPFILVGVIWSSFLK